MNNYCPSNNKPQGSGPGVFRSFLFNLSVVLILSFSSSVTAAILSGTVYLSGDPLPNTAMNLIDSSTDIVLDTTLTDGLGAYRFTLENGNYRIGVVPPANLGLSNTIIEDVLINSADLTYHIVLLQPAVVLSGVVRAPDGTPVNNVELSIFDAVNNLNVGVLKTKTDGSYSFPLAGGNYYINAQAKAEQSNVTMPSSWYIKPLVKNITVQADTYRDLSLPFVTLSGRIFDSNNQSVENVYVNTLKSWVIDGVRYQIQNRDYIKTDNNGDYQLPLLSASAYSITLTPPANNNLFREIFSGIDALTDSNRDFTFSQSYVLSGKVLEPNNNPVSGVWVTLLDQETGQSVSSAKSDASGNYQVYIGSGVYSINVSGYGADSNISLPSNWNISPLYSDIGISQNSIRDIVLPITRLSGNIEDELGSGIEGVVISGVNTWQMGNVSYYTSHNGYDNISNADGGFGIVMFAFDNYKLEFSPTVDSQSGNAFATSIVNNIDVSADSTQNFALVKKITVSGKVNNKNAGVVDNVQLTFTEIDDNRNVVKVTSDSSGSYSVQLRSGVYSLSLDGFGNEKNVFSPSRWYIHPYNSALNLSSDTTYDITVPFVYLTGTITDSTGQTISNVELQVTKAWVDSGKTYYVRNTAKKATTDMDGQYVLPLLSFDDYPIALIPTPDSRLSQIQVDNVSVLADGQRDFVLQLLDKLTGVVKTPSGVLVSGVNLLLYDQSRNLLLSQTTTDTAGTYEFDVDPGTYYVNANGYGKNSNIALPQNWYINPIAKDISVVADKVLEIILPVVTISGKTIDSNGVAVSGVGFSLQDYWVKDGSNYFIRYDGTTFRSDDNGQYMMGVFPFDRYTQTIIAPNGSGFLDANIRDFQINQNITQDVVLLYPDTTAPLIISGPFVTQLTSSMAVIEWQTDEPASSEISYRLSNSNDSYSVQTGSGFRTLHSVILTELNPGAEYEYSASSTDNANNGPTTSDDYYFITADTVNGGAPKIVYGPIVEMTLNNSAIIEWVTDTPATSTVFYGEALTGINQSRSVAAYALTHRIVIDQLSSETVYNYYVESNDIQLSGPVSSSIDSFVTHATIDSEAPIIVSGPSVINVSDTSVVIVWDTNEPATGGVSYNDGIEYGIASTEILGTHHEITLSGLNLRTMYNYVVSSTDAANNGPSLSASAQFITLGGVDTNPPQFIVDPYIVTITHQSAVIRWETDELSNGVIRYGFSPDVLDQQVSRAALVRKHTFPVVGLNSDTLYYYQVISEDNSDGYSAASKVLSFTTAILPDTAKPTFYDVPQQIQATKNSATLSWESSEPTDALVSFGTDNKLSHQVKVMSVDSRHQITLHELEPGKTYTYRIQSHDQAGNQTDYSGSVTTNIESDISLPQLESEVDIAHLSDTTIVFSWVTDEISDSRIVLYLDGESTIIILGDPAYSANHKIAVPNLIPGTSYNYTIRSRDVAGNSHDLHNGSFIAGNNGNEEAVANSKSSSGGGALTVTSLFFMAIYMIILYTLGFIRLRNNIL